MQLYHSGKCCSQIGEFESRLTSLPDEHMKEQLRWLRAATDTVQHWHDYWKEHEWSWIDPEDGEPYLFSFRTGYVSVVCELKLFIQFLYSRVSLLAVGGLLSTSVTAAFLKTRCGCKACSGKWEC